MSSGRDDIDGLGRFLGDLHPLTLASASPRRREILERLGIPVSVRPIAVDESVSAQESPDAYLERVVDAKLEAALRREVTDELAVLVADTTVTADGTILVKPVDTRDARRMLRFLSGRTHQVLTRFAVAGPTVADTRPKLARTVCTEVTFRELDQETIERYVATGEGTDKAGGYAIQGIGAFLVTSIRGSYSNVVGLPAAETIEALIEVGAIAAFPLLSRP